MFFQKQNLPWQHLFVQEIDDHEARPIEILRAVRWIVIQTFVRRYSGPSLLLRRQAERPRILDGPPEVSFERTPTTVFAFLLDQDKCLLFVQLRLFVAKSKRRGHRKASWKRCAESVSPSSRDNEDRAAIVLGRHVV